MNQIKKKVLFLCTHNSARSQLAEGLLRSLYGDTYQSFSAGTHPSHLNPYVAKAMTEVGIDITQHFSKNAREFINEQFDYVVTVCDNAKESCPFFPGGKEYIHHSFQDPNSFTGSDEEIMAGVRKVRAQIKEWIIKTFEQYS